jgi:hypothetical protein
MSGMTALAVLLLVADGAGAAEPVTAEQVIKRYREIFPTIDDLDCPPGKGAEIVVCGGRDPQDLRVPPSIDEPGRRVRGDTPLTSERVRLDNPYACVSNKGCAKATIPIFSTGRRAPGAPKPFVDIIANAIRTIAEGD